MKLALKLYNTNRVKIFIKHSISYIKAQILRSRTLTHMFEQRVALETFLVMPLEKCQKFLDCFSLF